MKHDSPFRCEVNHYKLAVGCFQLWDKYWNKMLCMVVVGWEKTIFELTCSKAWIVRDNFDWGHNGGFHLWNTHLLATNSTSATSPPNTEQRKPIWNDFNFGIEMIWQLPRRSLCAGLAQLPRNNIHGGLLPSSSIRNCFRLPSIPDKMMKENILFRPSF